MGGLDEKYVKGIHRELDYWATWGPGEHLELGACGPVENGIFKREANVNDFGIEFETMTSPVQTEWKFISDKSTQVDIQAAGESKNIPQLPPLKAGIRIKFGSKDSIVFAALGGTQTNIDNIHRLKQELLAKAAEDGPDKYPRNFAVVTNLVTVDSARVIVSTEKDGEYAVTASADLKKGIVDLANTEIGVTVAHQSHVRTELDARNGATPLFRGVRLKRRWWFWLEARSLDAEAPERELPFDEDPFGDD